MANTPPNNNQADAHDIDTNGVNVWMSNHLKEIPWAGNWLSKEYDNHAADWVSTIGGTYNKHKKVGNEIITSGLALASKDGPTGAAEAAYAEGQLEKLGVDPKLAGILGLGVGWLGGKNGFVGALAAAFIGTVYTIFKEMAEHFHFGDKAKNALDKIGVHSDLANTSTGASLLNGMMPTAPATS